VIKIFDDRIEFFNPGDLYDGLTIEQLESNNYKSKTRNKLIALMFKECGLIEKYGSGIGRIKKFCKAHNIIEPKFEEMQKGFQVTLYKEKRAEQNSVGVNEIYDFIKEKQPVKANKIAEKFDNVT
jgi:ATP-dependent DNA helicase RecG